MTDIEFTKITPKNPRKLQCRWKAGEEVSWKHWRNALAVIQAYFRDEPTEGNKMKWLKCLFGHTWKYSGFPNDYTRKCGQCGLVMKGSYDMMHGTTEWVKFRDFPTEGNK